VIVTAAVQPGDEGPSHLAVTVRDHGPGLPAAAIPRVFDRFYKADSARARSEGSGLGLAIAWENARLHGGRIDAGNHPDGGAVFTVILPAPSECAARRERDRHQQRGTTTGPAGHHDGATDRLNAVAQAVEP
jgi:signal transduction histidine kinase